MAEGKWRPATFPTLEPGKTEHNLTNNEKKVDETLSATAKTAVALAFEPGDSAPKILATGKGHLAEKIIREAKAADVPFYQDNKLAETLSKLEIGDAIPPELYEVVAEILVFVDGMDKIKAKLDGHGM